MMQYKVNFISPVKIIKKTIDLLSNGHIGIVASMTTLAHGGVDVSTYSSSKYALYSFVNCLRQ
jgi:short-subunit dehydrogenase